ncbi:ATP-binding protein [Streptomyces sp. NPDC094149]|uniref:ATP-binding protein n=1 Tax=Streptomyces sp. NPDC094149 TaxID=3155079 RepID=UPI00331DD232
MAPQAPPKTGSGATTAPHLPLYVRPHANNQASSFAVTVHTPSGTEMPRIRHRVRAFLRLRRMPDEVLDDALLVTSELLTNAFLHALPPAALYIRCDTQSSVHIEVSDGGPKPTPRTPDSKEEHGRGLDIVAALCASHGTFTHPEGTTRWAQIDH